MYDRFIAEGTLIRETDTHYVTVSNGAVCTWSKRHYRPPIENKDGIQCKS